MSLQGIGRIARLNAERDSNQVGNLITWYGGAWSTRTTGQRTRANFCIRVQPYESNDLAGSDKNTPVKTDCLPFSSIPGIPPLFLDFLRSFDKVREFYARPPAFGEWWKDELQHVRYPPGRRQQVSEILERQNRHFGCGARTLENIQRLKNGASAVLTGQQVALFGGPMFVVLKGLTAALLAEKAGAVPIFWLATEDHDLAEVNFVHTPAVDHLETFTVNPPHPDNAPVCGIAFNEELSTLFQRIEQQFGASDVLGLLQASYRSGETFGSAFG